MAKKRISLCVGMIIALLLSLVMLLTSVPKQKVYGAIASSSGKFNGSTQSANLIPDLSSLNPGYSTGSGDDVSSWKSWWKNTMVPNGWEQSGITDDSGQVHIVNSDGLWGFRPTTKGDTNDDANLGGTSYTGGVGYRVNLSDADKVKANLGQLYVSGSMSFYCQGACHWYASVRVEFFNSSGDSAGTTVKATSTDYDAGGDEYRGLSLSQKKVPSGTSYIKIWYSNAGGGNSRKMVGNLKAYLHDSVAPSVVSGHLEKTSVVDSANNVVIAGNTIKYGIKFNETVSIYATGSASISLAGGTFMSSSTASVSTSSGVSTVWYTFVLTDQAKSGEVKFSGVSGLTVKDESGNSTSVSSAPSASTLTYYKTMSVSNSCSNLTFGGGTTAQYGANYTATLSANTGYNLPSSISVTIGGTATSNFTYNSSTGEITIVGSEIKGDIKITASGVAKTFNVTANLTNANLTYGNTATYDTTYTATFNAVTGYNFPSIVTISVGGSVLVQSENTYIYDSGTGKITIVGTTLLGDVIITASGVAKQFNVSYSLTKLTTNGGSISTYDSVYSSTLTPTVGYNLPTAITVQRGDSILVAGESTYTYNSSTGKIVFNAKTPLDNITITASGVAKQFGVTANLTNANLTYGNTATYDTTYTATFNAVTGYKFPSSITVSVDGAVITPSETTYTYNASSGSVTICATAILGVIEITANGVAKQYAVTIDMAGGIEGTASTTATYDSLLPTITIPTRTGYTFDGYYTSNNGKGDKYYNNVGEGVKIYKIDGKTTLYANWIVHKYTIEYLQNKPNSTGEVQGVMQTLTYTYDENYNLTKNQYSLVGWTFNGWSKTPSGGVDYVDEAPIINLSSINDAKIKLYAVWTANNYQIVLSTMGGNGAGTYTATYDSAYPNITVPERNGYNFLGYYSQKQGGDIYYDANGTSQISLYTITDSITIYAQWSPITYNIELYSQGSYVALIKDVVYGTLQLPTANDYNLTRDNYNFVGWNIYDEQNWAMYTAGTRYNVGLVNKQDGLIVVYAAWEEKPIHTLNFDANGGYNAPAMALVHQDETITIENLIPVRQDYTFMGWATTSDANASQYFANGRFQMGNSVVTLYAVWKHNPTLSYNTNGGQWINAVVDTYPQANSTVIITSSVPQYTGYVLLGWSQNEYSTIAEYQKEDEFTMPSQDVTLYAVWQKAEFTVEKQFPSGYSIDGLQDTYFYLDEATFTVTGIEPYVYVNGQKIASVNGEYTFVVTGAVNVLVTDGSYLSIVYSAVDAYSVPVDIKAYKINETTQVMAGIPTKIGYEFKGWTRVEGGTQVEYEANDEITLGSESLILYAVWEANTYTIQYQSQGGLGEMAPSTITYGEIKQLSENSYEVIGKTFVGWATKVGGTVMYKDKAEILNLTLTNGGVINLYAVWEKTITYIVFKNSNSGLRDDGGTNVTVEYGDNLPEGLSVPTRAGYKFAGYYTQANGIGDKVYDENMQPYGAYQMGWTINETNVVLYAYWIPISYTIIYANGGNELYRQTAVYDTMFTLILATQLGIFEDATTYFAGWSTIMGSSTVAYQDGQVVQDGLTQTDGEEIYLYVVLKEKAKASVTYNANGGYNAPVDNNLYYIDTNVTIPNVIPTKEGFIFVGWSYDPNSSVIDFSYKNNKFVLDTFVMPKGGVTLYAVWTEGETLTAQINEVKNTTNTLNSALNTTQSDVSSLTLAIEGAQVALENIEENYATSEQLQQAVADLTSAYKLAVAEVELRVSALETDLSTAKNNISTNATDINNLKTAMENAQNAIDTLDDTFINNQELETSVAQLKSTYESADLVLQNEINQVKTQLQNSVNTLNQLISDNASEISLLQDALNDFKSSYENAKQVIETDISGLKDKDNLIDSAISSLDSAYKAADVSLQQSIDTVKSNLNQAIENLTNSINVNESDIEAKVSALEQAYTSADTIINGQINTLIGTDTQITQSIAELEQAYDLADDKLQENIDKVQKNLENAVQSLTNSINANESDIEAKVIALKNAYTGADALINTSITNLTNKDTQITQSIAKLEQAYNLADDKLQENIDKVQENLDNAVQELKDSISNNGLDVESKLLNLQKACNDADLLLEADIVSLKSKDVEIQNSIRLLENAYKLADDALWTEIKNIQNDISSKEKKDAKTEKTYLVLNIALSTVAVAIAVTFITKLIKGRKK